ncbi:MAG: DUF1003 domain-containing protein [Bacteroidota bacterium]
MSNGKNITCMVCKKEFAPGLMISGIGIRHTIESLIIREYPEWNDLGFICKTDYNAFRRKYFQELLTEEQGQIAKLDQEVITAIHQSELLSQNPNEIYTEVTTFGERIADKVAQFGGSWKFIITFFSILACWIILNTIMLLQKPPFDPYPFILLNLVLSCIAAIQAPIIMMSQNRQESKDRLRSENDYKVNLKAEIEVRTLHEKMDHLLLDQWSRMMKIQELQMDMLEEINKMIKK